VNIIRENAVESGPKFTRLFPSNAGGNAGDNLLFRFLDISVHFRDIRAQSRKGSEIRPNLACFSPPPPKKIGGAGTKFLNRHL